MKIAPERLQYRDVIEFSVKNPRLQYLQHNKFMISLINDHQMVLFSLNDILFRPPSLIHPFYIDLKDCENFKLLVRNFRIK